MEKVIWVIDDDDTDHFIAQKMFQAYMQGMVIRPYTSAQSALDDLSNTSGEVASILLDLGMPLMNGFESFSTVAPCALTPDRQCFVDMRELTKKPKDFFQDESDHNEVQSIRLSDTMTINTTT